MISDISETAGFFGYKNSIHIVATMLIMCSFHAHAIDVWTKVVDGIEWKYTVENNEATIRAINSRTPAIPASTQGDITIPSRLGNSSDYVVRSIGHGAFYMCSELTDVKIPTTIKYIAIDAFTGCSGLTSITIPSSVTNIFHGTGGYVFAGCSGLKSVTVPECVCSLQLSNVFPTYYQNIETVNVNTAKNIAPNAFKNCSAIKAVTLPNSVEEIGESAFSGCANLKSITIPRNVKSIKGSTFYGCENLTTITLYDGITEIGTSAFAGCTRLNMTLPKNIEKIGGNAFGGCSSLTQIYLPQSIVEIGAHAFSACGGLQRVLISDIDKFCGISFANDKANPLYYAHNLYVNGESVSTLPLSDGLTDITSYAFYGCTNIVNITVPNSVTNIGAYAFDGYITPNRTVTFLGDAPNGTATSRIIESASTVFYPQQYADSFASIVPESKFGGYCVQTTWNIAFDANGGLIEDWDAVRYIEVGDGMTFADAIGDLPMPERLGYDFKGWFTEKDGGTQIYGTTTAIADVTYYAHWEENEDGSVVDGTRWFYQDCGELDGIEIIGIAGTIPTSLVIPTELNDKQVVAIGAYSLYRSSWGEVKSTLLDGVVSLTLNEGLKRIGRGAFEGCLFRSVYIPSTLETIESFAFNECSNLTSVTISEGVCALNECCFGSCKALSEITLPSSVTNLERSIWGECSSLTNVTFKGARPSLISSIIVNEVWDNVFYQIPEGLCVYVMDANGWKDENGDRLSTWCGRPVVFDPIPDIGDEPTAKDIAEALGGSTDDRLTAHITGKDAYKAYRGWMNRVCGSNFSKRQAVKDSAYAWLSFALDANALIINAPKQGDLKIDTFKPSATSGAFDFDISVEDIAIGERATVANLAEIFGIEGAETPNGDYTSNDVELTFGTPANGKVKCTARAKDATKTSFFMRVKMNP